MGGGNGTGRNLFKTDRSSELGLEGSGTDRCRASPILRAWHTPLGSNLFENCRIMSVEQGWPCTASSNTMECEVSEDNPKSLRQIEESDRTG